MPEDQRQNTRGQGADGGPSPADRIRPFMWKKGQSGNPGGRPKNESMTARLRRVLAQEHNGREIADLIAERIVKEALSGKFPFAKELLDRLEGLPGKDKPGNEPVVIQVIDVPSGRVREGDADDIRALMAPEGLRTREFTKLREFYEQCPAPEPAREEPGQGDHHGP